MNLQENISKQLKRRVHLIDRVIKNLLPNMYPCDYNSSDHFIEGVLDEIRWFLVDIEELKGIERIDIENYILDYKYDELTDYFNEHCIVLKKDYIQEHIKKVLKEERTKKPVLRNLLNVLFDGFDNIDYDWAEYNCGMGVCCDPYAVGFVLPQNEYYEYLFKLVDSKNYDVYGDYPEEISDELPEVCYESPNLKNPDLDTIVIFEELEEEIENYIGSKDKWKYDFIDIINEKFGCEAKRIIFI